MNEWKLVQKDTSEALARLHFFSVNKKYAKGEIEARITVKEFASAKTSDMQFYATADLELNQKALRFQPCGWSETLVGALGRMYAQPAQIRLRDGGRSLPLPSDCGPVTT